MLMRKKGDTQKALEYCNLALAISEKALGPEHLGTAITAHNLGGVMQVRGETEVAMQYFDRAAQAIRNSLGEDHPFLNSTQTALKRCGEELQKKQEAAAAVAAVA